MTRNLTILENEGTGLMNRTERAKEIFNEEIRALELTRDSLGEDFEQLVDLTFLAASEEKRPGAHSLS